MTGKNYDLSHLLKPYRVIAHAETFTAINDKIKDYDPNAVILSAVSDFQHYFGGNSSWAVKG